MTKTPADNGPVVIRWGISLGDGSDPAQVSIENAVTHDFNACQDKIHLVVEVIPKTSAIDTISTEIAAAVCPNIVGPMDWFDSNAFYG